MAASETQRLIAVSMGKIAQSRGQRGGINLHKNLLVATVLHKARTAYMMETYSYQQQQAVQPQQQIIQPQQQIQQEQPPVVENQILAAAETTNPILNSAPAEVEECAETSDLELGQVSCSDASLSNTNAVTSNETVPTDCTSFSNNNSPSEHVLTALTDCVYENDSSVCVDKENSPPCLNENNCQMVSHVSPQLSSLPQVPHPVTGADHLAAATKLAEDAQAQVCVLPVGFNSLNSSCAMERKISTSGSPTCTGGVLKRRRANAVSSSCEADFPTSKRARISVSIHTSFVSEMSDLSDLDYSSSDDSDSEYDFELNMVSHSSSDSSTQISNLVNIFNTGFSGLCASDSECNNINVSSNLNDSGYQSDFEITSPSPKSYTTLTMHRPESPNPSNFTRKVSESALLCSTEVGRLDSLPSAIVLSA